MILNKWTRRLGSLKINKLSMFIVIVAAAVLIMPMPNPGEAAGPPVLKVGSEAPDVWDLQYRLDTIGFNTDVDGIFGWKTRQSVMSFQRQYGLTRDGVVGPATWSLLQRYSYSHADVALLSRLVYSEARGESYKGQVAVAAVVLNRVHSNRFPDSISGVIFQKGAFTAVNDGQFWLQPSANARKAALDAIRGWDPANGALYYFNPEVATSKWIWTRPQLLTIGNHIFTA
jgi:N-acetylmuramoyl-L-alanine amidase